MLDVIGAVSLTGLSAWLVATLAVSGDTPPWHRRALPIAGATWFVVALGLAAAGTFSRPPFGTVALGAAVAAPLVAGLVFLARSRHGRQAALGIPLATLVGVHVGRLLGVFFLVLHAAGRLPSAFALTAGWGDILVAAAALPVAWAVHRGRAGWWWIAAVWNTLAIADLVTALTLGVGSAPGSPVRFIFEPPGSAAISTLPWALVPTFLVPFYMLTNLMIFGRLAAAAAARGEQPRLARA